LVVAELAMGGEHPCWALVVSEDPEKLLSSDLAFESFPQGSCLPGCLGGGSRWPPPLAFCIPDTRAPTSSDRCPSDILCKRCAGRAAPCSTHPAAPNKWSTPEGPQGPSQSQYARSARSISNLKREVHLNLYITARSISICEVCEVHLTSASCFSENLL